jgi:Fe-S-cluster-containing dehydrogenase component
LDLPHRAEGEYLMDDSRRDFLKKAGAGSLIGLGVVSAVSAVVAKTGQAAQTESANASGIRWGMVIDMRKCIEGCTVCSDVCHALHNVPDIRLPDGTPDRKNELKWIWKEPYYNAFPSVSQQFVSDGLSDRNIPVMCNQCAEPPCCRVCPTQATFKRDDGIVMMDFHRCVGCRFCMAACPYGSRSFNWMEPRAKDNRRAIGRTEFNRDFPTRERGVVEKCNFCADRLQKGEPPRCVDKCPGKAMTFGDLNDANSEIRRVLKSNNTITRKSELGTEPSVFYIV